ncbi:MAG TPA: hypothetical protein VNX70_14685 [Bryobacteraceae bacterium]|nr:hypothetical protein [Bryobacteraceae bacterium]
MKIRIGINLGDVMLHGEKLLGIGVFPPKLSIAAITGAARK